MPTTRRRLPTGSASRFRDMTDHYLLMTATPHKGDPENFCLFLALLDRDVYGNVKSLEDAMRRGDAPFYLRRTKEALVTFPDPDTGAVKKLFTKREVKTVDFRPQRRGVRLLRRPDPVTSKTSRSAPRPTTRPPAEPSASPWPCSSAGWHRASTPSADRWNA